MQETIMQRFAIVLALLAGSAVAASAQALPERVRSAGKLVIATQPNYAPIVFKDPATNQMTGFDIELGQAIARELSLKIEWQETAFAQMLPSLQTGRVDMVMAFMSDTPQRRDVADFVDYVRSGAQFYTTTNRAEIKQATDLCGLRVGASRATTWPADIAEWSNVNCVAKGLKPIEVVGTEGSVDARTQLKTGRLDGAVQGNETLPYFQQLEPQTYVVLGTAFTDKLVGIPFAKTAEGGQLRDAVKAAIERLQAKGEYDALLAKYGLQANALKPVTLNRGT
jgi:polar amino acid transport system substrate-binding protein